MSETVHYAGFWRRAVALFLDIVLFFTLCTPIMYLLVGNDYFYWLTDNSVQMQSISNVPFILLQLAFFVYLLLCWKFLGSSPGKILLGCRITNANPGQELSWKQLVIRLLSYILSALPLYAGFAWAAFDKKKQALHDKIAGTLVIQQVDDYGKQDLEELAAPFNGNRL